jgi:hypothetical protein
MKPLIPILIVASTSLAVASVQFHRQASTQRERADTELALRQKQEARVAQLERSQAQLERQLMEAQDAVANANTLASKAAAQSSPSKPRAVASLSAPAGFSVFQRSDDGRPPPPPVFVNGGARPFESPAARNFLRTRMKVGIRRTYEDVGSELGLSDEKARQLIDLLADQQTRAFGRPPGEDMESMQRYAREQQQKTQAEITALIGQDKMDEWTDYQKTLPYRSQLGQVREQLESSGYPMTDSQRKQMLAAISEVSERSPRPAFNQGLPPEESMAQMNQWQEEFDAALLDRAKEVLSADQYNSYKEYHDYQSEMRNSFGRNVRFNATAVSSGSANTVIAAPAVGLTSFSTLAPVAPPPPEAK